MIQSHVKIFINGREFSKEDYPYLIAFNQYFGADYTSILTNELREKKGLVYEVFFDYVFPLIKTFKGYWWGYFMCQSNKTIEALEITYDLINNMPHNLEDFETTKIKLIELEKYDYPGIRELSEEVERLGLLGYEKDPTMELIESYRNLTMEDIISVYNKYLKSKPSVIIIVGDKKQFDFKELSKYGKVIEISAKDIF